MCRKLAEDSLFQKIFTIQAPGPRGLSAESLAEELATFGMQSQSCTSLCRSSGRSEKITKKGRKRHSRCLFWFPFFHEGTLSNHGRIRFYIDFT